MFECGGAYRFVESSNNDNNGETKAAEISVVGGCVSTVKQQRDRTEKRGQLHATAVQTVAVRGIRKQWRIRSCQVRQQTEVPT